MPKLTSTTARSRGIRSVLIAVVMLTPPKVDVITMTQTADSFAWSEVFTLVNDTTWTESWSGKMDGVARPVAGPANAKASYSKDGSGKWSEPEGNSDLLATVSADGKQFILTSTSKFPNGKVLRQRFVYDLARAGNSRAREDRGNQTS